MNSISDKQMHGVNISMRKHMDISGVKDVESFDELGVTLKTVCGELVVEGKDIKVSVLDTERGVVSLDGKIDALFYSDSEDSKKRGFFGKLTK